MTLTKDKAVAVFPIWPGGIDAHYLKVECGHDFGSRKSTTGMTGSPSMDESKAIHAQLAGDFLQLKDSLGGQ